MAGMKTAKALLKETGVGVTIVQAQDYVEQPILMPYFLSHPELYSQKANSASGAVASLPHLSIKGVRYALGTATAVKDGQLVLNDGATTLPFDVLVIATGTHYPAICAEPGQDFQSRKAFIETFATKVRAAKSILIGGGGPVAVEMAATLREISPSVNISMAFAQAAPMSSWTGEAGDVLAARLAQLGITLLPNERMEAADFSLEPASYKMSSGKEVKADIFLPYFGKARTEFLDEELLERGLVKVNPYGQSVCNPKLFAVGCSNKYRARLIPVIQKEAQVVARNVVAFATGDKMSALLPEKQPGPPDVMWVHAPLGGWMMLNPAVMGTGFALLGRCCGCFNPLCPCCACCGFCCAFPASSLQGRCIGKKMLGRNMHEPHKAEAPDVVEMSR